MKTISLVLFALLSLTTARAQFPNNPAADRVLGAADFTSVGTQGAMASGMMAPAGVAVDPTSGKLFVATQGQHRILRFPDVASLANGADAEAVLGQANFTGTGAGATGSTLNIPSGLHVDGSGRLWVADQGNHRVLMFENASTLASGASANRVFGQQDFVSSLPGTTAATMKNPVTVFVDTADNLWVADTLNSRVLKFAAVSSLANGAAATAVLGQPNFVSSTNSVSTVGMSNPYGVTVDANGRLWVADGTNDRVLRFDAAAGLASGAAASGVLGQLDFVTGTSGTTPQKMSTPLVVLVDSSGTLFVSDAANNRILMFENAAGKTDGAAADRVIGQSDLSTGTVGTTAQKLSSPYGLTLEPSGRLWVADQGNHRVLGFPPATTPFALDAPLTAALGTDLNGNIEADAGDGIVYTLVLSNFDDAADAAVTGVAFTLTAPAAAPLEVGSLTTTQGTVTTGNTPGDDSIEVDIGTIADAGTVTVTFTLKLGLAATGPLLAQGTVTSDLPGSLLTDDPALSGKEDPTEFAVNFTFPPATFTVARLKPVTTPTTKISGMATDAVSVEVKRLPKGPVRIFPVVGTTWSGKLTGLKVGSNRYSVRALGKNGAYTSARSIVVKRLKVR